MHDGSLVSAMQDLCGICRWASQERILGGRAIKADSQSERDQPCKEPMEGHSRHWGNRRYRISKAEIDDLGSKSEWL